jgi:hypothetical protein
MYDVSNCIYHSSTRYLRVKCVFRFLYATDGAGAISLEASPAAPFNDDPEASTFAHDDDDSSCLFDAAAV